MLSQDSYASQRIILMLSHRMGGMTSGHTGCLFVTTLRLSLQLHTAASKERGNKLLGEQDVTLSSIEAVYEVIYFNNYILTTPTRCRARLATEKAGGRGGRNWHLVPPSPISNVANIVPEYSMSPISTG